MNRMFKTVAAAMALTLPAIGANATIHYVTAGGTGDGSSWSQASGDLQAAIDASSNGDEIWVSAGTYAPTTLIKSTKKTSKAFILKDGVSLYGGFEGNEASLDARKGNAVTILNADDETPDTWTRELQDGYRWTWATEFNVVPGTKNNSTHVLYCAAALTNTTVVDGFTLTGGNANVWNVKAAGGAVYGLGKLALKNCIITENSAYFTAEGNDSNTYGGAVYLDGGSMENCHVSKAYSHSSYGNGIGGGVYARNATIRNCTFEDCVGLDGGGAVYMVGGVLENCDFTRCYASSGGAIYNNGGTVRNITVLDCRALNGGGVYNAGTLTNALIRGCYADAEIYSDNGGKGGAICNLSGDISGIAAYNNTSWDGGGIYLNGGRVINATVLNNTIRSANGTANVAGETEANTLNSITDPATSMSNFIMPTNFAGRATTDAQTILIQNADWSLAPGSEFIDKGTAVDGYTSGTDLAGNPRMAGAAIDRGAYESQGDAKQPTIILTFAPGTEAARIGVGGASGYEFTIDWGDGKEVTYNSQAYYSHLLSGTTVKIYGDDIIVLQAPSQDIIAADVSRAKSLMRVMLGNNGLTSLTLGSHPSLTGLYAEQNKITSLDVSGCPALTVLDVHENAIEGAIDCSAMASLSKVDIADNCISSFKLPKHSKVYEVDCSNNLLTEIDVKGLSGLSDLSCSSNKLTSVDLTGLTSVEEIYFDGNDLTSIDISPCTSLTKVMVAENALTSIDLSRNPALTGVYVQDNQLAALDVTANPNVRWLNLGNNKVSTIDVSKQKNLSILIATNNSLQDIDLSNNTSISSLDLAGNAISAINLTKIPYLSQCHLENNALTSLDVTRNTYLYGLFCGNNQLSTLDITNNTYLQRLEAQGNALTSLDITRNTGLQELLLQSNKMDKDAVNALIAALPDVNNVQITPDIEEFIRQLNISNMPGTPDANVADAQNKGWFVTAEYEQEQPITLASLNIQINKAGERFMEVYNSTIEFTNDEHTAFRINNFMESSSNVVATMDADGNVKIAPQVCGGDSNGNFYMIVNSESKTGNPMAIYNTYVSGKFNGETLTLDPWNFIIVPYTFSENLGTAFPQDLTSTFVKSNGTMSYTTTGGSELNQNVYAEIADGAVNVYGWGEYAMVTLTKSNGMWKINAQQTACTVDGTDYVVATPEGTDVVSTSVPDPRTLLFGAWQIKAATGSGMLRNVTSTTLKLGFDLPSITTGIDDIATDAEVIDVIYYNAAGICSSQPFQGLNIKVETLSNGTRRTSKILNRF